MSAYFSENDQARISAAIEDAERFTSGEIRVCVEPICKTTPVERAISYFKRLGMDKTKLHNGVLIYISTDDHQFAIIGDQGIDRAVPADFWESTKEAMLVHFKAGDLVKGLTTGIGMAGEKLQQYFPFTEGDINELPNEIVFLDKNDQG